MEIEYFKDGELIQECFSTVVKEEKEKMIKIIEKYQIQTMHTKEATLEEIFIKVTGRGLI